MVKKFLSKFSILAMKYTLMNKLSYENTKHFKNLVFLLLQYLIITVLSSEFPN